MNDNYNILKKRLLFFLGNLIVVVTFLLNYISKSFMPVVIEYGKHQCDNISSRLINYVVSSQLTENLKEQVLIYVKEDHVSIDFNTAILNSIASNSIKKIQYYFYMLENGGLGEDIIEMLGIDVSKKDIRKGIFYEVPLGQVFNNVLLKNLGVKIPVRYRLIGNVKGQIISLVKEYGINNALVEINLEITSNVAVSLPLLSENEKMIVTVPLVMKLIQGEIPNYFFGSNVLGEVN